MPLLCKLAVILAEEKMQLKELHKKTGLNYTYLSDIKRGHNENINLENALIIAKALDRSVEEIWKIKK